MHILMYNIFVHQSVGRVRQITRAERAGFTGKSLHKISVLKYILQNLVRSTSKSVTSRCFCYF
jgi:hypothetical protein